MRKFLFLLLLAPLILGCPSATSPTPPQALAPGYTSQTDQQFGQALAAARALANQAAIDYGKLSPADQYMERNAVNGYIAAVNAADAIYQSYHLGTGAKAADVQVAISKVNTAQSNYTAAVGVK